MSGWIKLHRSLQKWGWKKSPNHTAVFIDLLLEANHAEREHMGINIQRGSLTTSVKAISNRSGVSQRSVRTILEHLKSTNEVAIKTTTKFTMISIVKWDQYQLTAEPTDKPVTNDCQATDKKLIIKEGKNNSKPECLVIDYYNQVNERSLKQVESNYKEIRARLKEGHTVEDLKMLIDYAAKTWSNDPFWADKNRPSTLFNSKFDGYLQTAKSAVKPKIDPLMALAQKHLDECALMESSIEVIK